MKVKYKGHEVEGTVGEIKQLLGAGIVVGVKKHTRKYIKSGKYKKDGRRGELSKAHKDAISKGQYKRWKREKKR